MKVGKKLLSVLLSIIMIMTSMSVCFGTFSFTAAAEETDYIAELADKLKDSAYAETLGLLGKSSKTGSGLSQKTEVTFTNYRNFKQAAELLRLVDNAMKQTEDWKTAETFSGVGGSAGTDNESACGGRNTNDLYNTLVKELEKKSVTIDNNIKTFLGSIYHTTGATLHTSASKNSSKSTWTNTVTYTTSDYKGYLAQIGKASAVESAAEMSVKYSISMKGDVYYQNGCDEYYHHQLWPASLPVSAPATNSTNADMKSQVNAHISKLNTYINMEYADMLEMSASALDATVTELNTAISNHVTYVGGQSTYDSLYADYATGIANFRSSVQSAKDFANFMPTVDAWNDFVDANPNYGVFQYPNFGVKGSEGHTKLLADYATFKAYRDYLLTGGSIYDYLVDYNYIDETYYTNFYDNVVAYDLQDSKDAADALYIQYSAAVADTDGEGNVEMTLEEKTVVYNQFCGFINNISNYSAQVVAAVYTSGYQYLIDMREYFKCEINPAVLYFAENAYKSFTDMSTTAIWNEINVAKGHQADLDALYNEVKANAGQDKADQLLATLKADAATMIENLYKTLADRFTLEVNNAYELYEKMGKPTTLKVDTFLQLSAVIVAIEPSILTDLQAAGKAGYIAQVTIDRYNELMKVGGIYEIWNAYASTFGFPDYKQTQIQFADRTPMEGDELKTANDPVTEAEMLKLIDALDTIITSDTVGGILGGLLGAEEGEAFNLGTMLSDLIKGALFTDDFINTVVQMLYPLVLKEFDKVWAGLPQTVPYSGMNVKVQYAKTLHTILDEGNFEIYPDLLAQKLKELNSTKYAENIATLQAAGGESDSWESPKLVDVETGKLKLSWGVAEQAEKLAAGEITQAQFDKFFYDAFEDATSGLLPLLTSLITNVAWSPAKCNDIGRANPGILGIMLDISLQLGSEAHNGYADFLVPIYEILGVPYTAVSSINGSKDVSYVLEQILKPVFAFLDKLGAAPVDTLLEILPDLVYALAFRMAKPALNMLRTRITYDASATLVGSVLADGADVKVGDMLITDEPDAMLPNSMFVGGLNSILAHFGLAIPAIDQATLATLGQLTTMSTNRTTWIYDNTAIGSGKAYTIKADKADVGYYLLSYVLNVLKDPASLTSLLGLFMTQKDEAGNPILDAEGKKIPDTAAIAKLQETLYNDEGLNFDELNVGNAIAAIVELANQPEYIVDAYNWYAGEYSSPVGESVAMDIYANPNNDWTEAKAQYLYENLESLLTSVLTMAGADFNLETTIGDAINGLFTNETVTSLAKLLGSLSDLGALLAPKAEDAETPDANEPETVAEGEEATEEAAGLDLAGILTDLLKDELGIDLSVYAQYANIAEGEVVDFGVTDVETFVTALTELLKPLKPVVDFILGGKDLTLIDSAITLQGYNGYNNAIIPLLEALGATPAAYTDGADTLALTLNALVGVINKITTNDPTVANDGAIYTIIDMLPGIIYYISSNALSQGIDKLLTPVYALLDTIRPIYNLDIATLLEGIEVDFDKDGVKEPLGLDLKNINWEFIFGLLNDLLGLDLSALQQVIYDVAKSIGVEYTSASTLGTFKKGAYSEDFSQADLLTVVLSFVLEWATIADNAAMLDEMLGTNGIIASLGTVFESVKITYDRDPNWMYWFNGDEDAFNAYIASGAGIENTLASLEYPDGNDWDLETAQYFANNIGVLVDKIIAMINADKADAPKTVAGLIDGLLAGYVNGKTINDLVAMLTGLLGEIDENLIATAGLLLNVDLAGLKDYKCEEKDMTVSEFAAELANVLDTYARGLVNWLFFGDDYRFAKKSDNTDTIVINGGLGYEKGLALILEALGADAPAADEATTANVLEALATRVEAILANPVNEVLDLLPNLIYFLNANGAGVAVDNLLKPVNALLTKLAGLGLNVNLNDLIGIDLANLSLENVVTIVEGATDIPLDAAEAILVNFCTGKITKGDFIYKMEAAREDVITILLVVALELISDDAFAAKLDEMLGTDFIAQIKSLFAPSDIEYTAPEWDYALTGEGEYMLTYPNNWNAETATYIAEILPEVGDMIAGLIDSNYTSLSGLLNDKVNVFTSENLQAIVDLVAGLLGDIDEELLEVGYELLDVDLVGLKKHKVPAGITTVTDFADELANILNYAEGAIEWLLLGRDFKLLVKDNDGIAAGLEGDPYITINGAHGYSEGLALLLEALGCKNLPAASGETAAIVKGVLASLAARIDEIFANPVEEVINLLPNLLYFLNTNGVAAVIKNTTAAVMALVDKLGVFGVNLDLNELVNLKKLMGIEDTDAAISLDNLTIEALLEAVSYMVEGLDLTVVESVLVGFDLGAIAAYDSVSTQVGEPKKMTLAAADTLTVLVNLVVLTIADTDNAEFLKGLIGEKAYALIENICIKGVVPAEIQNFNWQFTDKADTDYVFSAIESTKEYNDKVYGPLYTEEMAEEIADNFGAFVNNIIYLLGIQINGQNVNNAKDLINGLLNGSLYNSSNVIAIRDALAGVLAGIADLEVNGANVGNYIANVLAKAEIADIADVAAVEVPEFSEDRELFVQYLCDVLEPLYPVLKWVLSNQDIAFFVNPDETDAVKLAAGEGYAYGIIPLLEALGCKDVLSKDEYYAAVEADGDVVITSILNPLLNRVDEILADDPAQEILEMLPNLIYFINSNGVDTVVKNTLHAVYGLLNAIAPIAEIDLYTLIGIDLAEINMTWLINKLIEVIASATGFVFEAKDFDAIAELTVGKLESFVSANGDTAYRMVYTEGVSGNKAEMVTVILRLAITFLTLGNNIEALEGLLVTNFNMSADAAEYLAGIYEAIASLHADTYLGMNQALAVLYYVYYGVDLSVGELAGGMKDINAEWKKILAEISKSDDPNAITIGTFLNGFLNTYFEDIFTSDGVAPNGFISFFKGIIDWFNKIIEWFKNLFN